MLTPTAGNGPLVPASHSSTMHSSFDPNKPVADLLNLLEDRRENGQLTDAQIQSLDSEEPYVPLQLAEIRVNSMMGDLKDMKDDHVKRMSTLQKAYDELLRQNHKIANEMLDKARTKAAERIKFYKDKAQQINKQMIADKKAMERQQRANEREMRALQKDTDTIIRMKKDLDEDLVAKEQRLNRKHEEVRLLTEKLGSYEDKYRDVDGTLSKLEGELEEAKKELSTLAAELEEKAANAAHLEEALKETEAELVKLKTGNTVVSSAEMDNLRRELDDARAIIPILESDKATLTAEIARLTALGGGGGGDGLVDSSQVELLKAKLDEVDKARRAEMERFRNATSELENKAEEEKKAALATQQQLYDKMIKQMIQAGQAKEEAKNKKQLNLAADERIAQAQREAEEAARKKQAADAKKDDVDGRLKFCDDKLKDLEEELKKKKERLNVVEPEYTTLATELQQQETLLREAVGSRDRAAQYTEEQGREQMAKFNIDWDQVNGPLVAQLLDICKNYNLMKALQEDMRDIKAQHDAAKALSASPDLDIAGPAKVNARELAAKFNGLKSEATAHKAQWYNQVKDLGLRDSGVGFTVDEDFEQLGLAAEMWHEVMRKHPGGRVDGQIRGKNGAILPEPLGNVMQEFNLDPTAVNEDTIAALEGIVADFSQQRAKQEELKEVKADFDNKKALVKEKDDECNKLKQALAEAKAEGKPEEEVDALQKQVENLTKECAGLKKEAKGLMDKFNVLKPEAKSLQEKWKQTVNDLGLVTPQHTFEQLADFELLTYIANEFKDWQEKPAEPESESRHVDDDDLPTGPSDELRAQVQVLEEEKKALDENINILLEQKIVLEKEKEEYEDMQQMAALATVAANNEAVKARTALRKLTAEVKTDAGEEGEGEAEEEAEPEIDLTGGNVILLNEDIAEAHKELMDAKFALAQAQKQAEVYREQIHEERRKHATDLDELHARIRELELEIEMWKRKEIQWKVSAGTFYAKAGIGGVQSQSLAAHEFKTENMTDEESAKIIEDIKSKLANTQRELERAQKREREAIAKQREIEDKLKSGDINAALAVSTAAADLSSSSSSEASAAAIGSSSVENVVVGNAEEEARLRQEVDKYKAEADEQRNLKKKAEAELNAVKAQLATLEASSSGSSKELQDKLKQLSNDLSTAQTELADTRENLAAEIINKEEEAKQRAALLTQLEELKTKLEGEKAALEATVKQLETTLSERDAELEKKNQDLTDKIAQLAQMEDEMRALRDQLAAKDVEMQEKIQAQETQAAAALLNAQEEAEKKLLAQEAEAKAALELATEEKTKAVAALDGEIQKKEAALADASAKQTRIDELTVDVADWTKRHSDLSLKYIEEQERRKHFQQEYEAAKGKIRVYARIRPFIRLEKESTNPIARVKCVHPGPNVWTLLLNMQKNSVQENKIVDDWVPKTFDHIFLSGYEDEFGSGVENGSQAQVFKECEGFAEMAFDGLNTCIFAYGQSGSGKTWTMRGSTTDPEQFGLKPRMLRHVFEMQERTKARYESKISCSMFEIYNDEIQDIFERLEQVLKWESVNKKCYKCFDANHSFNECSNCAKCRQPGHSFSLCKAKQVGKFYLDRFDPPEKKLEVKVLGNQRVSIPGLQQRECSGFEEMQKLCDDAELLRRVRATGLNDESSRSHLIFAIYIEKKERNPKDKKNALPTFGKLSLCDLAGSEKVERTQMAADISPADRKLMIEEGKRINQSLSVLTSIFAALGAKLKPGEKRQLPRYRENLLTNCMQDSIGGNARTLMFVNVSPSLMNFEETKQTLSYGDLVQNITGTVATADVDVEQYLDRIAQLEEQVKKYQEAAAANAAEG